MAVNPAQNEVVTSTAAPFKDDMLDIIRSGLAVVRIENDTQQQIAVQRPRTLDVVMKRVMAEVKMSPDYAKKLFYSIPYKDGQGGSVNVEGLGHEAAMLMLRNWGNAAVASRISGQNENEVYVEGKFLDYETNTSILRSYIVPRKAWRKSMGTEVALGVQQMTASIQSGMSKAARNAVLAGIPTPMKLEVFKLARAIAVKGTEGKTLAEKWDSLVARFSQWKITEKRIIEHFKLGKGAKITEELLGNMFGLLNALSDGEVSAEEVFPEQKPESNGSLLDSVTKTFDAVAVGATPQELVESYKDIISGYERANDAVGLAEWAGKIVDEMKKLPAKELKEAV